MRGSIATLALVCLIISVPLVADDRDPNDGPFTLGASVGLSSGLHADSSEPVSVDLSSPLRLFRLGGQLDLFYQITDEIEVGTEWGFSYLASGTLLGFYDRRLRLATRWNRDGWWLQSSAGWNWAWHHYRGGFNDSTRFVDTEFSGPEVGLRLGTLNSYYFESAFGLGSLPDIQRYVPMIRFGFGWELGHGTLSDWHQRALASGHTESMRLAGSSPSWSMDMGWSMMGAVIPEQTFGTGRLAGSLFHVSRAGFELQALYHTGALSWGAQLAASVDPGRVLQAPLLLLYGVQVVPLGDVEARALVQWTAGALGLQGFVGYLDGPIPFYSWYGSYAGPSFGFRALWNGYFFEASGVSSPTWSSNDPGEHPVWFRLGLGWQTTGLLKG